MKLSVVIPTYNRRKSFERCLESVFTQSYKPFEIIVVDSSEDIDQNLANKYKIKAESYGLKLRYIIDRPPTGVAASRNVGIKNSKGDIIVFIDDDCVADKYWLENLAKEFNDEDVAVVGGKISWELDSMNNKNSRIIKYWNRFNQKEVTRYAIVTANSAFRKEAIESIGGFDETLKRLEDFDVGIRLRLNGLKIKYSEKAKVYHELPKNVRDIVRIMYSDGFYFAHLSKKYGSVDPDHFNPSNVVARMVVRFLLSLIKIPFFIFDFKKFVSNIFTVISIFSSLVGFIFGLRKVARL